jgi:hypothetical protein
VFAVDVVGSWRLQLLLVVECCFSVGCVVVGSCDVVGSWCLQLMWLEVGVCNCCW